MGNKVGYCNSNTQSIQALGHLDASMNPLPSHIPFSLHPAGISHATAKNVSFSNDKD